MKFFHSHMDERERMEMYTVEHYFFWVAFWGLLAAILVQDFILGAPFNQSAGEWVVFMVIAVGSCIGYARKGVYDGGISQPGVKSYLLYSGIGSLAFSILIGASMILRWQTPLHIAFGSGIVCFVFLFVLLFATMALLGAYIQNRRKKLEEKFEDEDESDS